MTGGSDSRGRVLDAGLSLLDRQVLDRHGLCAGKVDDLELTMPDEAGGAPIVTAILQGPLALGRRLGGRLGVWWIAVARRLRNDPDPRPCRIPFELVTDIDTAVHVSAGMDELDVLRLEHWWRDHVIVKVPGSGHAAE